MELQRTLKPARADFVANLVFLRHLTDYLHCSHLNTSEKQRDAKRASAGCIQMKLPSGYSRKPQRPCLHMGPKNKLPGSLAAAGQDLRGKPSKNSCNL